MYQLRFYALDGASVQEGDFDTLEEAQDRWENIGSRWFFYPLGAIFKDGRSVEAPDGLDFLDGLTPADFKQAVITEAEFLTALMEA